MRSTLLFIFTIVGFSVLANEQGNRSQAMHMKTFNFESFHYREKIVTVEVEHFNSRKAAKHPEFGINPFNTQCRDCFEVIDKRTYDERFYIKHGTDGGDFFVQKSALPIHYYDKKGNWMTLDYHLRHHPQKTGVFMAPFQFFPTGIDINNNVTTIQVGKLSLDINSRTRLLYTDMSTEIDLGEIDWSQTTVGKDGAYTTNAWDGINLEQVFKLGKIKTSYVIHKPLQIAQKQTGYLVFEETIELPKGFGIFEYQHNGGYTEDNFWRGELVIRNEKNTGYIKFETPFFYNWLGTRSMIGAYDVQQSGSEYRVRLLVPVEFLSENPQEYPIVIDPLVSGFDSMGMYWNNATALFPPPNQYVAELPFTSAILGSCDFNLNVTVPGESEIINTFIELEYWNTNTVPACDSNWDATSGTPVCVFTDASMEVVFPQCNTTTTQLICQLQPVPPHQGTCTTDSNLVNGASPLAFPNLVPVQCVPPQCPDYNLDFVLRNRETVCNDPPEPCNSRCAEGNMFMITIHARTLESLLNQTFIDTGVATTNTICPEDSVEMTNFPDWGVPPYTYLWSHGGMTDSLVIVQPLQTTHYTVTVFDQCGNFVVDTHTIIVKPIPPIDAGPDQIVCDGEIIQVGGSPTTPAVGTFWWSAIPPVALNYMTSSVDQNPFIQLPPGTPDTVMLIANVIEDDCVARDTVYVGTVAFPEPNVVPTNPLPLCANETVTLTADAGYSVYTWSSGQATQSINVSNAGNYQVTVEDANGCTGESNIATVTFKPEPQVDVTPIQSDILLGESVSLTMLTDTTVLDDFYWSPGLFLSCTDCVTTIATPTEDMMYIATVVLDSCVAYDTAWVNIIHPVAYTIPNAFSPNEDGTNDIFQVIVVDQEVEITEFKVFNRWGEKVYDDIKGRWDGTWRGEKQPISTFTYMIKLIDPERGEVVESGNVTLVR